MAMSSAWPVSERSGRVIEKLARIVPKRATATAMTDRVATRFRCWRASDTSSSARAVNASEMSERSPTMPGTSELPRASESTARSAVPSATNCA